MSMLIGLVGPKGSGKSTLARELVEQHNFTRMPLAGPLKAMIRTLLRERGVDEHIIDRMVDGNLKEKPTSHFGGKSTRHAMQTLGTEWGRDLISPTFWLDTWTEKTYHVGGRIVCDDVRFPNEGARVRLLGGIIVRVVRPGLQSSCDAHTSETWSAMIDADYAVHNNEGELASTMVAQLGPMGVEL